jgi:hypothetical protein
MKRAFSRWWLVSLGLAPAALAWVPDAADVWPDGSVPIARELSVGAPSTAFDWNAAARAAMTTWNGYLQRIQLTDLPASGAPWYDNGRNELFFDHKVYGTNFGSGVLAVTVVTTDRETRVEADVVFNADDKWSVYGGPLQSTAVDFQRVAVHELGHVLGLDHPDEAGQSVSAIMNAYVSDTDAPTADDQAGVHALYDRNSSAAPVILAAPSSSTVTQGAAAKLVVVAGGRGPYTYTWRRGTTVVADATASTLTLPIVALTDAGSYTVTVSNARGAVTSQPATLTVVPAKPPAISSYPWSASVTAGDDYAFGFSGNLAAGDDPIQFEWRHDGVLIATTGSPSYTLKDAQFSDAGSYTMTAINIAGTATTAPVTLAVNPGIPPQFLSDHATVAVAMGGSFTLACDGSGSRPIKYQWQKEGADLPGATGSTFSLFGFKADDAGNYTVTMTNAFGQVTSPVFPVVVASAATAPPLITAAPVSITEFSGGGLSLSVTAEGADLKYRWFKDGVLLPEDVVPTLPSGQPVPPRISGTRSAQLGISGTTVADSGIYTAEVSNALGTATSRGARVTLLKGEPVIASQPASPTVAVGASTTLAVEMRRYFADYYGQPDGGGFTYQWYKDGSAIAGATGANYNFNAQSGSAGKYFVRIASPGGTIDSAIATVTVVAGAPPLITSQPGDQWCDSGDSEALRLEPVALVVLGRRAVPAASSQVTLVSPSGPAIGGFQPGTYVVTATNGTTTETSQPFQVGMLTPIVPVIYGAPGSRVVDLGQTFSLFVNAWAFGPMTYQWYKNGAPIAGATSSQVAFASFAASDVGSYSVAVTSSAGTATSESAVLELRPAAAPIILAQPLSTTVTTGSLATFSVTAAGGAVKYQWLKDGAMVPGATDSQFAVVGAAAADAGGYAVVVSNGTSSITSRAATLTVVSPQRVPVILYPPKTQTAAAGGDVTLVVGATGGALPNRYQWRKDGVDIPGATDAELRLHEVQASDAGSYSVVAYNTYGNTESAAGVLTVDTSARLVNIATRARVGTGNDVLVAGFVIAGNEPRSLLIRGVGEQLSDFNVTGVLRNPLLRVFDVNSKLVTSSDDWAAGSETDGARNARVAALAAAEHDVGAFPLREDTRDAALIATLPPGNYTAEVSGVVNTTGIGLVEIYELGRPSLTRLINMSCRSYVGTGDQILIPSLVVGGQRSRRLLIRASGPALDQFHVDGWLPDPRMKVMSGDTIAAENDNWGEQPEAATLAQLTTSVGGFPLAQGSKDAAIIVDLPPGPYTIQVDSADGTTGVALVEVYEIPEP